MTENLISDGQNRHGVKLRTCFFCSKEKLCREIRITGEELKKLKESSKKCQIPQWRALVDKIEDYEFPCCKDCEGNPRKLIDSFVNFVVNNGPKRLFE